MKNYIATFYSHFGAIRFSRELQSKGLHGTVKPVPRNLSSSCGTCVAFEDVDPVISDPHGEIEQVVQVTDCGYTVIYRAENS